MSYDVAKLVDEVARRTRGTKSDPLTREEVEQIVLATLAVLEEQTEVES